VFECSGPERMGNIVDLKTQAGVVINIDHHAHHNYFGHINLINPKASSNSEQLFYVFKQARMKITREEAEALYVGLVTDTGRFQQENTNRFSHEVASGLHAAGINVAEITRRVYNTRTESSLKLLGRALSTLRLEAEGRISVMRVTRADFEATGSNPEETEDVINHGLMVPTVQVAVFLRDTERPNDVKVSFRGKGRVDLCKIAVGFGGGGHKNASGCNLAGTVEDAERRILAEVRKALPAAPSPSR
jgi:bifunctional oligoribonuclease and PAP phosphatase NrnA